MPKRIWTVLVVAGMLLSLMGCRAAPVPAAAADELERLDPTGSEVILWHSLTGPAADTLAALADEFNASNPWRIVVVPHYQGAYSQLRARLDESLTRGASPDLVVLHPYHAAGYALQEQAITLNTYIDSARYGWGAADRADIFPVVMNSDRNPQLGHKLTSFPMERSAIVLYYNLDWLKALGYQGAPLTWPAFKDMCQRASVDLDGDGPPDTFGYAFVPDGSVFSALVLSRGGTLVSDDARQVKFNSDEGVRAMNILHDVFTFNYGYVLPAPGLDRDDWAEGKALFTIGSSKELPSYRAAVEKGGLFRWGATPLPHNTPDPVAILTGQSWTVFKSTPQRQLAAWLFIRWFTGTSQTRRWAEATTTLPFRNSAAQAMRQDPNTDPNVKNIMSVLPFGQSEPAVTRWESARQILADTMLAVINQQAPAAALQQAEAKVNALIK